MPRVVPDKDVNESLSIDGFGQLATRRPTDVAELGQVVREAAERGEGLYPVAGGTALDFGFPPIKPGLALDLRTIAGIVDHPARDLTVTVRAATSMSDLQKALAAEGQRLPVDVVERATLGGALATNRSGPRRLGFGTLRDYVIGIRFITDAGIEVKAGGRVVKNVAGYDLMKLQIGALGTLGIITEVTLKVSPRPEDRAFVAFGLSSAAVGPTLDRLHASASRPVILELLNAAAAKATGLALPNSDPFVIVAGFEEKAVTVNWQVSTLKDELKAAPIRGLMELRGDTCEPLDRALTALQSRAESRFIAKASVLPSRLANFASVAAANHSDLLFHAHAGNGIAFLHLDSPELTVERASALIASLAPAASDANGRLTVRRCPSEWKKVLPVAGSERGDHALMRTVKRTLDPQNLFNPGRLFGNL